MRSWDIAGWFHRTGPSLALAYATAGRLAEALPLFEATAKDDWARGNAQSLAQLAQGYLLSGRTENARSTAARALELACAHGERANEALALYVLGTIDAQSDAFAQAEAHYRNARTLGDELGMRPLIAHCHLGLGKLYRRSTKADQAQRHLATAMTMYREMGMTYWLEQAEAEGR